MVSAGMDEGDLDLKVLDSHSPGVTEESQD
jgi:hypothetical protein